MGQLHSFGAQYRGRFVPGVPFALGGPWLVGALKTKNAGHPNKGCCLAAPAHVFGIAVIEPKDDLFECCTRSVLFRIIWVAREKATFTGSVLSRLARGGRHLLMVKAEFPRQSDPRHPIGGHEAGIGGAPAIGQDGRDGICILAMVRSDSHLLRSGNLPAVLQNYEPAIADASVGVPEWPASFGKCI